MKKKLIIAILLVLFLAFTTVAIQNGYDQFQKALAKERGEGNLEEAIALYQKVIEDSKDESLSAKAQLRIGFCYEKLGLSEAQKAFQKVVDNYPNQLEAVKVAREKLMTLTRLQTFALKENDRFHLRRILEGSGWWRGPSISPNGEFFAFSDRLSGYGEVATYDLSSGKIQRLSDDATESEGAYECAVSPDGKRIAYSWLNNSEGSAELRVVGLNDSKPKTLFSVKDGLLFGPYHWSSDCKHILVYHQGIVMISADDGSLRTLKKSGPFWKGHMRISPDGRHIAYDRRIEGNKATRDIFILATDGSYDAPLIEKSSDDVLLDWCPDGKSLLFASDRTGSWDAWQIKVKEGKPDGSAELVKSDLGDIKPLGFTSDGSFYFMSSVGGMDIYTTKIDMSTGEIIESLKNPIERPIGDNLSAAWSPDGKYLAYVAANSIHIRSEETGEEREIFPHPGFYDIQWFPDGSSIKIYGENAEGKRALFRIDIETGAVEPLLMQTPEAPLHRACLGSDGKTIYYSLRSSEKLTSIRAYNLQSKQEKEIWRGERNVGRIVPSPDGQWLALSIGQELEAPAPSLAIMSSNGGEIIELLRTSFSEFVWAPDSKHLLFAKFVAGSGWGNSREELWIVPASGGTPKSLSLKSRMMWLLTIHPDGKRIAYTSDNSKAELWVMENFLPKGEEENPRRK